MKLFFARGACSLNPHIILRETGLEAELVRVDLRAHRTAGGDDYYTINAKGSVPALQLDDGSVLTEGVVIAQYLAELAGRDDLLAAPGEPARYRALEWLSYIGTELHKTFSPLFNPALPAEAREAFVAALLRKFAWVDSRLEGRDYLLGDTFSLPDAYLFTVSNWCGLLGIDITGMRHLAAFRARVAARPAVTLALAAESAAA